MTDLLQASMAFVIFVLYGLFIAAPVVMGGYVLLFSRSFILRVYEIRKAVWKMGYSDFDLKAGRVIVLVVGVGLLVGGLIQAAQTQIDASLWAASAPFMPLFVGALLLVFQVPLTDRIIAEYPLRLRPTSRWPFQLVVAVVALGFLFVGLTRLLEFF